MLDQALSAQRTNHSVTTCIETTVADCSICLRHPLRLAHPSPSGYLLRAASRVDTSHNSARLPASAGLVRSGQLPSFYFQLWLQAIRTDSLCTVAVHRGTRLVSCQSQSVHCQGRATNHSGCDQRARLSFSLDSSDNGPGSHLSRHRTCSPTVLPSCYAPVALRHATWSCIDS